MNFQKIFIIFALLMSYNCYGMKKAKQTLQSTSRFQGLFTKKPLSLATRSLHPLATSAIISTQYKKPTPSASHSIRNFSTSQTTFGISDFFQWHLKTDEQKKENLFSALKDEVEKEIFPNPALEAMVKKIRSYGFINKTLEWGNYTPLLSTIEMSKQYPVKYQEYLAHVFKKNGANFNDYEALSLAVDTYNVGFLKVLQPHFNLTALFIEFVRVKNTMDKVARGEWLGWPSLYEVYDILNRPVEKQKYHVSSTTTSGKESETTFEASTCEELFEKTYKKKNYKQSTYGANYQPFQYSQKSDPTDFNEDIDVTIYKDPKEQELYKLFKKVKRAMRPEEILDLIYPASTSSIKDACMKCIQQCHPDRFNYDKKLQEMATEVTKKLNQLRTS